MPLSFHRNIKCDEFSAKTVETQEELSIWNLETVQESVELGNEFTLDEKNVLSVFRVVLTLLFQTYKFTSVEIEFMGGILEMLLWEMAEQN